MMELNLAVGSGVHGYCVWNSSNLSRYLPQIACELPLVRLQRVENCLGCIGNDLVMAQTYAV
jgi:hypothetical protein